MRKLLMGALIGIVVCGLLGFVVGWFWPWPTDGTSAPGRVETEALEQLFRMAVNRQAPKVPNPIPVTHDNLFAGMRFFRNNCAGCHGDGHEKSSWGTGGFYPRVPQFGFEHPEWTDAQIFWITKYGVRYTGMGAWKDLATDEQLWKVAMFLSRVDSLPPDLAERWKNPPPMQQP